MEWVQDVLQHPLPEQHSALHLLHGHWRYRGRNYPADEKVFHPSIHIVANCMELDENGFLGVFKGQLMHTYKNSPVCENSSYFQQLQGKSNILLLGDSMEDCTMADGFLRTFSRLAS